MPINITDEFHAATTKGKIASAKEVFLTGDTENLQQIGEKTHQLEDSIKNIAATGGASTAAAVTFDNAASGMTAVNAQGAIEELNTKNKAQDTEIAKKANSVDVTSQIQTEHERVNVELDKKFDKENVVQEFGEAEDKVVSQKKINEKFLELDNNIGALKTTRCPSKDRCYISDNSGNVVLKIEQGEIRTAGFDSTQTINKTEILSVKNLIENYKKRTEEELKNKQDKGNYIECESNISKDRCYISDNSGNVVLKIEQGEIRTAGFDSKDAVFHTTTINWGDLLIRDIYGNVLFAIKKGDIITKGFNSNTVKENLSRILLIEQRIETVKRLIDRKNVPRISWIDDDFNTTDDGYHLKKLNILHDWCMTNNIRPDFALIPDVTYTDEQWTDITNIYFEKNRLALIKQYEREGFHFLMHPVHKGLYNNATFNTYRSDEYATKDIMWCIQAFRENGIKGDNILVYPGASANIAHNRALARANFECAILPGGSKDNIGVENTKFELMRLSIDNLSDNYTVDSIKQRIDKSIEEGAWIIIMSHCHMKSGDGTEAVDNVTDSFANLFDIISYANNKVKIAPTQQVWEERRILWDFYSNNKLY